MSGLDVKVTTAKRDIDLWFPKTPEVDASLLLEGFLSTPPGLSDNLFESSLLNLVMSWYFQDRHCHFTRNDDAWFGFVCSRKLSCCHHQEVVKPQLSLQVTPFEFNGRFEDALNLEILPDLKSLRVRVT